MGSEELTLPAVALATLPVVMLGLERLQKLAAASWSVHQGVGWPREEASLDVLQLPSRLSGSLKVASKASRGGVT